MLVYLLRHGIAVEWDAIGVTSDAERALTAEGWERLRLEAAGMRALKLKFDLILTSPLRRARETAQAVAEAYGPELKTIVLDALAFGSGFRGGADERSPIFAQLGAHSFESALLVGHQPDLGKLASALLTGGFNLNIDFKKGALCAISAVRPAPHPHNELLWLMAPRQLRLLGQA